VNSAELRAHAIDILTTKRHSGVVSAHDLREATVWAELATAAAIEEAADTSRPTPALDSH
jgi:hypothetical protein